MGKVYLPNGLSVTIEGLRGNVKLEDLLADLKEEEASDSFRLTVVNVLRQLGSQHISHFGPQLRELAERKEEVKCLLAKSASEALAELNGEADMTDVRWNEIKWRKGTSTNGVNMNKENWYVNKTPKSSLATESGIRGTSTTSTPYHPSNLYGFGGNSQDKTELSEVSFVPLDDSVRGFASYRNCHFCGKMCMVNPVLVRYMHPISGNPDRFFCCFCLRNDFHRPKYNRNIMILTMRGIFGYYYYSYYVAPKVAVMYESEIKDSIQLHIRAGAQNPLFRYDDESYCWFIDFSKVGPGKVPVEWIQETVIEMLAALNLYETVYECSPRKLYQKYHEAILAFHGRGERLGSRVFAPTLVDCDIPTFCPADTKPLSEDLLTGFVSSHLVTETTYGKRKILPS